MAFTGIVTLREFGGTGVFDAAGNPQTHGMVTSSVSAAASWRGESFGDINGVTLGNAATADIGIETSAADLNVTLFFSIRTSGLGTFEFRRAATYTGGTAEPVFDFNDITNNTPDVSVVLDPTITDPGTAKIPLLQVGVVGQGNTTTGAEGSTGFILAPSTQYLIQLTSLAADNVVAWELFWNELPTL